MADGIYIKGLDQLTRKFTRMGKNIGSVRLMGQIGAFVNLQVKTRTSKGVDKKERTFPPYSPAYRKKRQDAGHPVNKVNLFFTGSMFSSLTYTPEEYQVTSFFMNTVDKFGGRNPEKAFFNDQSRPFFGLTPADVKEIEKMVGGHIQVELKK